MKLFIVLAAFILSAQAGNVKRAGWSSPTTAPGWGPTQAPPSGWGWGPTQPPPSGWGPTQAPPSGWGWGPTQPPPSGWNAPPSSILDIELEGQLSAVGAGWAASNHAETLSAVGDDQTPVAVFGVSQGEAFLDENGALLQLTDNNGVVGQSINFVNAEVAGVGDQSLFGALSGLSGGLTSSGASAASGAAASDAAATSHLSN